MLHIIPTAALLFWAVRIFLRKDVSKPQLLMSAASFVAPVHMILPDNISFRGPKNLFLFLFLSFLLYMLGQNVYNLSSQPRIPCENENTTDWVGGASCQESGAGDPQEADRQDRDAGPLPFVSESREQVLPQEIHIEVRDPAVQVVAYEDGLDACVRNDSFSYAFRSLTGAEVFFR